MLVYVDPVQPHKLQLKNLEEIPFMVGLGRVGGKGVEDYAFKKLLRLKNLLLLEYVESFFF